MNISPLFEYKKTIILFKNGELFRQVIQNVPKLQSHSCSNK